MGKIDDTTPSEYEFPIADFTDPDSSLSESYRTLRTNFQKSSRAKSIRSVLITSAVRNEGRTQTVANLAVILASLEGSRTLLIDADLRHPKLHEIFKVQGGPGLSELLQGTFTLDAVIQATQVRNLQIISSGNTPQGSAELFHSPRLAEAIGTLKTRYDVLLFDSPPVIPYTDAIILAGYVEGILLVVKARETRREVVRRAKGLLNQSEEKCIGVVLNSIEYVIPRPIYEKL